MKKRIEILLDKYQERYNECEERFDEDVLSLKIKDNTSERIEWLNRDMTCLNAQLGTYECIIKDLKELLNEISR